MFFNYITLFLANPFKYYIYTLAICFTIAIIGNILINNNIKYSIINYITQVSEKSTGYLLLPYYGIYRFYCWFINEGFSIICRKLYHFISLFCKHLCKTIKFIVTKLIDIFNWINNKVCNVIKYIFNNLYPFIMILHHGLITTLCHVYYWTIIGWQFLKYVYFRYIHLVLMMTYNVICNICNQIYDTMSIIFKNVMESLTIIINNIYDSMVHVCDQVYISIMNNKLYFDNEKAE
jgi:phage-related protein